MATKTITINLNGGFWCDGTRVLSNSSFSFSVTSGEAASIPAPRIERDSVSYIPHKAGYSAFTGPQGGGLACYSQNADGTGEAVVSADLSADEVDRIFFSLGISTLYIKYMPHGFVINYGVNESNSTWRSNRGIRSVRWLDGEPSHVGSHTPIPGASSSEWEDTVRFDEGYPLRTLEVTLTNGTRRRVYYWQEYAKSMRSNWIGHASYRNWDEAYSLFRAGGSPRPGDTRPQDVDTDMFILAYDPNELYDAHYDTPLVSPIGSIVRMLQFDLNRIYWWIYEVRFDAQYGDGGPEPMWLTGALHIPEATEPIPSISHEDFPVREGYRFMGYYTRRARQGRRVFDENGAMIAVDGRSSTIADLDDEKTLYAGWEVKVRHVITLESERGYFASWSDAILWLYDGDEVPLLPDLSSSDPEFRGWYWDAGYTKEVEPGAVLSASDPAVIYARFGDRRGTKVTFGAEPGDLIVPEDARPYRYTGNVFYYPGGTYAALPSAYRRNVDFLGWYTAADGGERIEAGAALKTDTSHVLYAHWDSPGKIEYMFIPNGGTIKGRSDYALYAYIEGAKFGRLPIPERAGHVFEGWYYDYSLSDRVTPADIAGDDEHPVWAMYAKWRAADASYEILEVAGE